MRVDKFYESRQGDWKALSNLLDRSQNGVRQLTPEEIDSLGRLYRAATLPWPNGTFRSIR
jgi:hypothetical protein